jgi:nicotinamide mononucleotide (NMN) deamidase PncC
METTREMVAGLRNIYGLSSIYNAVTGVASPSTPEYPLKARLGQIFVCCSINGTVHEFEKVFESEDRNKIRQQAVELMMEKVVELVAKI